LPIVRYKKIAIANRSRVSSAHTVTTVNFHRGRSVWRTGGGGGDRWQSQISVWDRFSRWRNICDTLDGRVRVDRKLQII